MATELKITSSAGDPEDILKHLSNKGAKLVGKGYVNKETGVQGIVIFDEEDQSRIIDIFFEEKE